MTVTNDERREVVARLRATKAECDERGYPWMVEDLLQAIGFERYEDGEDGIFDKLADLIDPTCEVEGSKPLYMDDETEFQLSCGHAVWMTTNEPPAYCTECGARVIS